MLGNTPTITLAKLFKVQMKELDLIFYILKKNMKERRARDG